MGGLPAGETLPGGAPRLWGAMGPTYSGLSGANSGPTLVPGNPGVALGVHGDYGDHTTTKKLWRD